MTTTKAEIIALAQMFCQNKADATTIASFFDEVMDGLANLAEPPFFAFANFNLVASTGVYAIDSTITQLSGVNAVDIRQLSLAHVHELEAYDIDWRTIEDDPLSYLLEEQDSREFRLFPIPDANSGEGRQFGGDAASTAIQEWYALYIAFASLAKEFGYISDHEDGLFAEACASIQQMLGAMLGIK